MAPGQTKKREREYRWGDDWIVNQGGREEERELIRCNQEHMLLYIASSID